MKQGRWMTTRNAGNLYTPSERPGGNPAKRSFPTVLTATAFTALLVFLASIYLAGYATAGKNEERRRARAAEIQESEARVNELCALLDARLGSMYELVKPAVAQSGDTSQRTDFVIASAAGSLRSSPGSQQHAWLTSGKEGVARLVAGMSAKVARPAAAEASTLSRR
jgi:hypothetical protein